MARDTQDKTHRDPPKWRIWDPIEMLRAKQSTPILSFRTAFVELPLRRNESLVVCPGIFLALRLCPNALNNDNASICA